jgi:hypothetical protein
MNLRYLLFLVSVCILTGCASIQPPAPTAGKMPAGNDLHKTWRSVKVGIPDDLPPMGTFNKLDPKWWFGNADDPEPPDDYRPGDAHRTLKWYVRNPFHNAFYYVIGVRDRERTVTGRYPSDTFAPHGGWNVAVTRYKTLYLPLVSYTRSRFQFYLGWRASGGFGIKFRRTETVEYASRK